MRKIIKEKKESLKNNKRVKLTLKLIKAILYLICLILSFKYSIIIANNIMFGLHKILEWGTENMTRLVFGILMIIVTTIFIKNK